MENREHLFQIEIRKYVQFDNLLEVRNEGN